MLKKKFSSLLLPVLGLAKPFKEERENRFFFYREIFLRVIKKYEINDLLNSLKMI